jgi:hypothetical protein
MMPRSYARRSQTKINIATFYHLSMSSLSQARDRDPSQSVRAEKKREFAAVMEFVLNDVPDYPLASKATLHAYYHSNGSIRYTCGITPRAV